jgi:hypothetical protein
MEAFDVMPLSHVLCLVDRHSGNTAPEQSLDELNTVGSFGTGYFAHPYN